MGNWHNDLICYLLRYPDKRIHIKRGKMPRLRGVEVLRNGARCPAYGVWGCVAEQMLWV